MSPRAANIAGLQALRGADSPTDALGYDRGRGKFVVNRGNPCPKFIADSHHYLCFDQGCLYERRWGVRGPLQQGLHRTGARPHHHLLRCLPPRVGAVARGGRDPGSRALEYLPPNGQFQLRATCSAGKPHHSPTDRSTPGHAMRLQVRDRLRTIHYHTFTCYTSLRVNTKEHTWKPGT